MKKEEEEKELKEDQLCIMTTLSKRPATQVQQARCYKTKGKELVFEEEKEEEYKIEKILKIKKSKGHLIVKVK